MKKKNGGTSIFRALFVPLILIMMFQAITVYIAAVYGGVEESLTNNAVDILAQRLHSRQGEIEARFNNRWTELDDCRDTIDGLYAGYEESYGEMPLRNEPQRQIDFLEASSDYLIKTLRYSETNGIFLILNNQTQKVTETGNEQVYGLCIRDMDQDSNYNERDDLLLERAPSTLVGALGCSLDSWWEAHFFFEDQDDGDFYYAPLMAAWDNPDSDGNDLAYLSAMHQLSGSDPKVLSYSIPLISEEGYPYAVLGVEVSLKYLASLLPSSELNTGVDKSCYILATQDEGSNLCRPVLGSGALYNRCFDSESDIDLGEKNSTGGYTVTGRQGTELSIQSAELEIYNNNNPFAARKLVLLAVVESETLFAHIGQIKSTLLIVAFASLLLGVLGLTLVSRRFAAPITALAKRVDNIDEQHSDFSLERLGITEIDQLVDSIEELNRNVSRNSARTEFFSRMSHDMRTPMNAIISFSSAELLENADEAVKDDYLGKIHASGIYLLELINEVLDMTKIESDMIELHMSAFSADSLFDTTVPVIEKLAQKKGVSFNSKIRVQPGLWVIADCQHINQVLINLLSNAVKFTPQGGSVWMDVDISGEGDNKLCQIKVVDTGIGMSAEFMTKLYRPFAQESDRHEGTGLGLSIAKKLTELMGGSISCKSEKGLGTTFNVTVPIVATKAPRQETEAKADYSSLKGKRVLVCEDNAINTQIVVSILTRVGICPETAENGQVGIERFENSETGYYSAILMDIRMPVMNGLDAARAIRASDREDAKSIPILAMTADAFVEDAESSFLAGMNKHLSKPVEPQKLYDALAKCIAEREKQDKN